MSYQVLARKWRPHTFSQVVGQEHVVKALSNALEQRRMHHAYLFCGTRGVGKTTIARILAKALNCEALQGFDPCGTCPVCEAVDAGGFVDLIEVDAASRTKVEDTRDLLSNVQYAPTQGRYKIYLIDEVHMLSGHSFNALLKTLEEPPAHVKFLLATTDPQKIPVTVLSRCLQFNLKRMRPDQICGQMASILDRERIDYDRDAVRSLAVAADGSMRDGLSLLDQAIAHGGGRISSSDVSAMLGTVGSQSVLDLLSVLADGDGKAVLQQIQRLSEHTPDFSNVLQTVMFMLHRLALAQVAPDILRDDDHAEALQILARKMRPEDIQLYYQIGLIGQRDLPLAPDGRSGFEMVVLRMLAFKPVVSGPEERPSAGVSIESATTQSTSLRPPGYPMGGATNENQDGVTNTLTDYHSPHTIDKNRRDDRPHPERTDWLDIVQDMGATGLAKEIANHCVMEGVDDTCCTLLLDPGAVHLRSKRVEQRLEKAVQDYFGKPLKLTIRVEKPKQETPAVHLQRDRAKRQQAAERAIEQDENIRALKEAFDATIIPGSIEPLD